MPETSATDARKKSEKETKDAGDDATSTASSDTDAEFPVAVGMKAGTDAMRRMMEVSADVARFYTARMGKQMGYMAELATCRSPSDFLEVYGRAVSEAAEDLAVQLGRLSEINHTDFTFAARSAE